MVLAALVTLEVFGALLPLTGTVRTCLYFISSGVAALGIGLVFYALLPLHHEGRFFTLRPRTLPDQRRPFYRWGCWCALVGAVLLACLLLSHR